jgi:hypothetical protein
VIVDLFLEPLLWVADWLVGLLPEGTSLNVPGISGMLQTLAEVDSLIPIAGPLTVVAVLLPVGVVFLLVRLILMVRHVVLP